MILIINIIYNDDNTNNDDNINNDNNIINDDNISNEYKINDNNDNIDNDDINNNDTDTNEFSAKTPCSEEIYVNVQHVWTSKYNIPQSKYVL